jgi:hypothetical protein
VETHVRCVLLHSKANNVIHVREDGPVKNAIDVIPDTLDRIAIYVQKVGYQNRIYLAHYVENANREDGVDFVKNVKTVLKTIKTRCAKTINGMIQIFTN